MNINTKQKKLIVIILSSALLIFIFVLGINTYYRQDEQDRRIAERYETIEIARSESNFCLSSLEFENGYRACCVRQGGLLSGLSYDCTSQEYFAPGQELVIIMSLSDLDIPLEHYFLQIDSDLKDEENKPIMQYENHVLSREHGGIRRIVGVVPNENIEFLTLLKLSIYPDGLFNEEDEQVVLFRIARTLEEAN
jgi:hypothetical protein